MAPSRTRRSRKRFDSIPDAPQRSTNNVARWREIEMHTSEPQNCHRTEGSLGLSNVHSVQSDGLHLRDDSAVQEEDSFCLDPSEDEADQSEFRRRSDSLEVAMTQNFSPNGVKIPNWLVLWGLLMTNGNRKITKSQYQSVRILADAFGRRGAASWLYSATDEDKHDELKKAICALPHCSTLHTVFKPILYKSLIPRARDYRERVNVVKAGARATFYSAEGNPETTIRIILPSEFARADVSTGPTFKAICSTSLQALHTTDINSTPSAAVSTSDCVDIWPLIAARKWYYGPTRSASVDDQEPSSTLPLFCEAGDSVKVVLLGHDPIPSSLAQFFAGCTGEHGYCEIRGVVVHVWDVHHTRRLPLSGAFLDDASVLSQRDRLLAKHLSFSSYCSPTDSVFVEIPLVPVEEEEEDTCEGEEHITRPRRKKRSPQMNEALKRRRNALKQQKKELESAWRGCKKPLLKPSDVVVMLRPADESLSPPNSTGRVFLVYRFWTEQGERTRHAFWVPGDSAVISEEEIRSDDLTSLLSLCAFMNPRTNEKSRDVVSVTLVRPHQGERGLRKYPPVSSIGELDNGEKYVIYRFLLFWDGFEISAGKSASGEGFYLLCLNFPVRDRSSPNAVRVISLTPPGVKSDVVFKRIQDDLLQGITDGFLDIDANGQTIRIFLDLVGFIGDTPAINAALDVLGHNACACCHLCRFLRGSSTIVGSRYTTRSTHAFTSACGRSFQRHTAIHDPGAQKETCRLLGMKPISSDAILPIHSLRSAMMAVRSHIPTTRGGMPILSAELDPYRGCLIAPDHLLTGHAKDIINLAFKLLPSREYRVVCEGFMIGMLKDCGLGRQNRLLDPEKRSLYSMTMTELYALLLVAELGFVTGCSKMGSDRHESAHLSERAKSAIALVGSFSKLVAKLWIMPSEERDGKYAVAAFEKDNGDRYLQEIQSITVKYLEKVQAQCSMADSDVYSMEDTQCDSRIRMQYAKVHRECSVALKTIDKPNVHRLQELVFSTLPMVGHISRIGELVMETAHQGLKSAIKRSNKKDVHLLAMESTALSDWQGRLTMLSKQALLRDKDALRGCYRLFAGRESLFALGGVLNSAQIRDVLQALGPPSCVPRELENQSCSVLSSRSNQPQKLVWRFVGVVEVVESRDSISTSTRRCTYDAILNAHRFETQKHSIRMGNAVSSTLPNGMPGPSFQRGDVVETLCFYPHDLSYHFPFLMQPGDLHSHKYSNVPLSLSLWCISTVFTITRSSDDTQFFASVLPCFSVTDSTISMSFSSYAKYRVRKPSSLDNTKYCIARLDNSFRKVGVLHNCMDATCALSNIRGSIAHCDHSAPLESGVFFVLDRKSGFPPRQG